MDYEWKMQTGFPFLNVIIVTQKKILMNLKRRKKPFHSL